MARRDDILDAALDAFAAHGYEATTIAEIRRRSGASTGSIYHRFGDKRGIAAALYVDCLRDYQRGVVALLARHPGPRAGIEGLVVHHLRWVAGNPRRATFLADRPEPEVERAADERVRAANAETFAALREWMAPHVAAAAIRRMPLRLTYAIVLGPSQEYTRQWLRDPSGVQLDEAQRALARAAWEGVRGKAKTR